MVHRVDPRPLVFATRHGVEHLLVRGEARVPIVSRPDRRAQVPAPGFGERLRAGRVLQENHARVEHAAARVRRAESCVRLGTEIVARHHHVRGGDGFARRPLPRPTRFVRPLGRHASFHVTRRVDGHLGALQVVPRVSAPHDVRVGHEHVVSELQRGADLGDARRRERLPITRVVAGASVQRLFGEDAPKRAHVSRFQRFLCVIVQRAHQVRDVHASQMRAPVENHREHLGVREGERDERSGRKAHRLQRRR